MSKSAVVGRTALWKDDYKRKRGGMARMGEYQRTGELRFIVSMQWEDMCNPYGTIAYFDDDRQTTKAYCGLADLLFQMDAACDEQGHPQRDTAFRSFAKTPMQQVGCENKAETHWEGNCRKMVKFLITICVRQNFSIQGFIQARKGEVSFRSGIELLVLLRELLECEEMRSKQRPQRINHEIPNRKRIVFSQVHFDKGTESGVRVGKYAQKEAGA